MGAALREDKGGAGDKGTRRSVPFQVPAGFAVRKKKRIEENKVKVMLFFFLTRKGFYYVESAYIISFIVIFVMGLPARQ